MLREIACNRLTAGQRPRSVIARFITTAVEKAAHAPATGSMSSSRSTGARRSARSTGGRDHHGAAAAAHALERPDRHRGRLNRQPGTAAWQLARDLHLEAAHAHPARSISVASRSVRPARSSAVIPSVCNEAFILNFMFTGVVNHWVTVLGIEAVSPARTEGESWVG
jgi:hypothetical protein